MWRMSKQSGVEVESELYGQYQKRIRFLLAFAKKNFLKNTLMSF